MATDEGNSQVVKPNDGTIPIRNKPKNVSNKLEEALMLPTCINLNPRSIYNKVTEFITLVKEKQAHCIFLSESWERPEFNLNDLINIEDFKVISNPFQRKGQGGRPALIVNTRYYHVRNLRNTLIQTPWGCEATWALLIPKQISNASKIQKIALCSLYSKPDSRNKTKLLDHISLAYNIISAKFQTGLHFIIAGDTNDLKLDSILHLDPKMQQVVQGITRLNPPRMLDPILTTLGPFYQTPEILPPLDADPDSEGKPSDHLIPMMIPINDINNQCSRVYKQVKIRPVPKSGMQRLRNWFEAQGWSNIISERSIDKKAEMLQSEVLGAINLFLPEKIIKVASDDSPWFTQPLKKLDRKRRREYNRNRRSEKYITLCRLYKEKFLRY